MNNWIFLLLILVGYFGGLASAFGLILYHSKKLKGLDI